MWWLHTRHGHRVLVCAPVCAHSLLPFRKWDFVTLQFLPNTHIISLYLSSSGANRVALIALDIHIKRTQQNDGYKFSLYFGRPSERVYVACVWWRYSFDRVYFMHMLFVSHLERTMPHHKLCQFLCTRRFASLVSVTVTHYGFMTCCQQARE